MRQLSSGTIASFLPKGARSFRTVEIFGLVVPRSKRAMTGWLTALIPRLDEFADQGDAQIALGDFFGRQERVDIGDCILLLSFILAHR